MSAITGTSFTLDVRIYYEDTDSGGVVYYANYLKYFERARTEFLRSRGVDAAELARERKTEFAVTEAKVFYRSPAKLGEVLSIETRLEEVGGASMVFGYRAARSSDGQTAAEGSTKLVCLGPDFKPARIPRDILEKLKIIPR